MTDFNEAMDKGSFPRLRRLGVDHYTEHDFEMERIGDEQSAGTYAERLEVLEAAGWVPFRGRFRYARRQYHAGHLIPGTKKRVPTGVAFAMFKEGSPDIELPAYKPHPHGWTRPTTTQGLFHNELVSVKPMKVPAGNFLTMSYEYGTPEEAKARRERQARMDATFKELPGVRSYGDGSRSPGPEKYIHVTLEAEEHRAAIPETWEGLPVDVRVKAEAEERAEEDARRKSANERYQEEAAWVAKANRLR